MTGLVYSYESLTSSLKVWGERSPLSEWAGFTIVKKLRFQIIFKSAVTIVKGNQNQLENLIAGITSYVDRLLSSHINQNIDLKLSHRFDIPTLQSFNKLEFSTLELFDLVTNLELLTNEVEILPALNPALSIDVINKLNIPIGSWLKIAAGTIAAIGITTGTIKFLAPERYTPSSTVATSPENSPELPDSSAKDSTKNLPQTSPKDSLKDSTKELLNELKQERSSSVKTKLPNSVLPKSQAKSQPNSIDPSLLGSLKNDKSVPTAPPAKFPELPQIPTRSQSQIEVPAPPLNSVRSDRLTKSSPSTKIAPPKSLTDNISPVLPVQPPSIALPIEQPPAITDSVIPTQEIPNSSRQRSNSLKLPNLSQSFGRSELSLRRDSIATKNSQDKSDETQIKIEVTKIEGSVSPKDLAIYRNKIENLVLISNLDSGASTINPINIQLQIRWKEREIAEINILPISETSEISQETKLEIKNVNLELIEFIQRSLFEIFPDRDGNLEINLKISR